MQHLKWAKLDGRDQQTPFQKKDIWKNRAQTAPRERDETEPINARGGVILARVNIDSFFLFPKV